MLSRSSIFLKLMGSFYEQIGSTEFMRSYDEMYSSLLLSRYADVVSSIVSSNTIGSVYNSVHFGYMDPLEIDVSSREIVIRSIDKNIVTDANFISMSFYDADVAYSVDNIDGRLYVDMNTLFVISNTTHVGMIPIIYGKSGMPSVAVADWLATNESISSIVVKDLMPVAIESLSKFALYKDSSRSTISKIVDVFLGAVFAKTWETVLRVDENRVYTTHNEYEISGDNVGIVVVEEGQELEPFTLITKISEISNDVGLLEDVQKINSFMRATGLPQSNREYLHRLSQAVAKRKMIINIPPEAISPSRIDILSVISEAVGVTASMETIINSFIADSSLVDISSSYGYISTDTSVINVVSSGRWILEIPNQGIDVSVDAAEKLILPNDSEQVQLESTLSYNDSVFSVVDVVQPSEESINGIVDAMNGYVADTNSSEGLYVDTNIFSTSDRDVLIMPDSGSGSFDSIEDGVPADEIKSATVAISDSFTMQEHSEKTIIYKSITMGMLNDTLAYISLHENVIELSDVGHFSTELSHEDIYSVKQSDILGYSESPVFGISDSLSLYKNEHSTILFSEKISSDSSVSVVDTITISDSEKYIDRIHEAIFIADSSYVESDTQIDS